MRGQKLWRNSLALSAIFGIVVIFSGCANNSATLNSYNHYMYKFNREADKAILKPLAEGYRQIIPDTLETGVENFFANLVEVETFVNSLLQGKFHNAALSSARLLWNSTLGIGGVFDVASAMGIKSNKEDFGQTLQVWGLPSGPYLVLPFFGPSTLTDSLGFLGGVLTHPLYYYNNKSTLTGFIAMGIINESVAFLDAEKMLDSIAPDEYTFVKNVYLQNRKVLVNDGEAHNEDVYEEIDNLFSD